MKTVLEVIQSTTSYFTKHGVANPRLNAEHLVAHALAKKRIELYLEFDRPLAEPELEPLRELVRRRAQGEPLQHLLGTVEFFGRVFSIDKRALIPRPETEQLCEILLQSKIQKPVLSEVQQSRMDPKSKILDVGTGSGIIALTLAAELENAEITAVDVSGDALALASENADKLSLGGRVNFFRSDLFEKVEGTFDLIVANLPYIATDVLQTLSREVRHDPHTALDGGADGREIISRLIAEAPKFLRAGGGIALEIGAGHAHTLREELQLQNYTHIRCEADYQGLDRFLFATYG